MSNDSQFSDQQRRVMMDAGIVGLLVFVASLFGIWTRPIGLLAAFWPANALLLGIMVRYPRLSTPPAWLMAVAGFYAADLITGGQFLKTSLLTAANLAGVATGYLLFVRIDRRHVRLREPLSVLYLILIAAAASFMVGMVGAIANPILFHGSALEGWLFWAVTELVYYMALLPVILALPDFHWRMNNHRQWRFPHPALAQTMPVLALLASCVLSAIFNGPGAIAFPVPALLWCAITYGVSTTAGLTLIVSIWTLLAISRGYLPVSIHNGMHTILSIRLGLTLITFAPLTVASVMAARNELFLRMQHMAEHDQLTGLTNRRAFIDHSDALLSTLAAEKRPAAIMMLDIDYFKEINDTFGHAAGDTVLKTFARTTGSFLRGTELFGRLGGEEFGILVPDCTRETALAIGNRVRNSFADAIVELDDGRRVSATVSVGIVFMHHTLSAIEHSLSIADGALYRAKQDGRNRVELAEIN